MLARNVDAAVPVCSGKPAGDDEKCATGADPRVQAACCRALSDLGMSDQAIARYLGISVRQVELCRRCTWAAGPKPSTK